MLDDVKERLAELEKRHKILNEQEKLPRLRRATNAGGQGQGSDNDSQRPTLKRRDTPPA